MIQCPFSILCRPRASRLLKHDGRVPALDEEEIIFQVKPERFHVWISWDQNIDTGELLWFTRMIHREGETLSRGYSSKSAAITTTLNLAASRGWISTSDLELLDIG